MLLYFFILAVLAAIIMIVSSKTCLLRDTVVHHDTFHANAGEQKIAKPLAPYSLARTQLAFWTVIILSSFTYLLIKYDFSIPDLDQVNLILLGIAMGTTATSKIIDDTQKNNNDNLNQDQPSQGWLVDILSDNNGVSIHRLQNVLWTIIVGAIYIQYVATKSSLPDAAVITNNLLILMGISTTAYVGIKTMENQKPADPNPPADPNRQQPNQQQPNQQQPNQQQPGQDQ